MNHIRVYSKNGDAFKVPFIRERQALYTFINIFTKLNVEDIEDIKYVINGQESEFKQEEYYEVAKETFYKSNYREKLRFFNNEINTMAKLEIIRNDHFRTKTKLTRDIVARYDENVNWTNNCVTFNTIKVVKSNGKIKERYVCKIRPSGDKKLQREVKNIIEEMIELEPEMLAIGKSVKESVKYFDEFETIVKIDFKDFFNQISYKKFYKALNELSPLKNEKILKSIAGLCCPYSREKNRRATWQGLSTSTIAAYVALLPMFREIKKYLNDNYGIKPVIYVDDLSFGVKGDRKLANKIKREVMKIIIDHKFYLNFEKCKVLYGNKTFFLGINMRTKALGENAYVKNLRAALNNFFHGTPEYRTENLLKIKGRLTYLKMINEDQFNKLKNHHKYGNFISELNSCK